MAPRLRAKDSQRRSISLRQHANLPCTRRRIGSTRLAGFLAFLVALALVRDLFLCAKHLFLAAIGGGWPWWSVALPCRRACARSRPDGGGSAGGCCRRSRLHSIGVRGPGRRGMGGCQPGPLAERIGNVELNPLRSALLCRPYVGPNASLVAQDPVRDLFVSAKDLFVEANGPHGAIATSFHSDRARPGRSKQRQKFLRKSMMMSVTPRRDARNFWANR